MTHLQHTQTPIPTSLNELQSPPSSHQKKPSLSVLDTYLQQNNSTISSTHTHHNRLSDYINRNLLKSTTPSSSSALSHHSNQQQKMQTKQVQYGKMEAEEMIVVEQERRVKEEGERQQRAKRRIREKEHQIIIEEIQENENAQDLNKEEKIQILEQECKQQQIGMFEGTLEVETTDSNNYNRQEEIEIIEEMHLQYPQKYQQEQRFEENQAIQVQQNTSLTETKRIVKPQQHQKRQSYQKISPSSKPFSPPPEPAPTKTLKNSIIQNSEALQSNVTSPQPRTYYKNNFSRQTKFIDSMKKESFNGTLKENLRNELQQIVDNYDQQDNNNNNCDTDRVEDMILELNRLTQKSNGLVPSKSQSKIQQFVNNVEMQKIPYSKRQSKSPTKSQLFNSTARLFNLQKGLGRDNSINVNSKTLKEIIHNTQSKVKQNLKGFRSPTSNMSSVRTSLERTGIDSYHNEESQVLSQTSNQQQQQQYTIKDQLLEALNEMNARNLSAFLKRRAIQVPQGDVDIAYIFILIVALVDESIALSNDKSDIIQKNWEEMVKQLSNHGRVIYSLQKLRIMIERKEQSIKQIQKLQIFKRYEERKGSMTQMTQQAQPIYDFTERIMNIFKSIQILVKQDKQSANQSARNHNKKMFTNKKDNYQDFLSTQLTSPSVQSQHQKQKSMAFNTPVYYLSGNTSPQQSISSAYSPHKTRPPTIQAQLIKQKQQALQKSYQLQLDQAKSIQQKQQQAKDRELAIAKLKLQQNYLLFQVDKQEIKRQKSIKKQQEKEYQRYQAEFSSRLARNDQSQIDSEKKELRERSLDKVEFTRAIKMREHEESLRINRENNEKSFQELQWKEKTRKTSKEQQLEEIKRKHQEIMIDKVRKSEVFLISKEQELDERIKNQFHNATYKFKQLDETENHIRKEIEAMQQYTLPRRQAK